jgi:hypothetical protein
VRRAALDASCQLESCMGMNAGLNAHVFNVSSARCMQMKRKLGKEQRTRAGGAVWRLLLPPARRPRQPHRRRPAVACSGGSCVHAPCGMAPCCTAWLKSSMKCSLRRPFTCSRAAATACHHEKPAESPPMQAAAPAVAVSSSRGSACPQVTSTSCGSSPQGRSCPAAAAPAPPPPSAAARCTCGGRVGRGAEGDGL